VTGDLSTSLGLLLMSYSGPESDRVRTAIAALANDDLDKVRHLLECANTDYRDVLWWAQEEAEASSEQSLLSGMTVNERLFHLGLMPAWDAAIAAHDVSSAKLILQRCGISVDNIEAVLTSAMRGA
jgi:hypothetical protein